MRALVTISETGQKIFCHMSRSHCKTSARIPCCPVAFIVIGSISLSELHGEINCTII